MERRSSRAFWKKAKDAGANWDENPPPHECHWFGANDSRESVLELFPGDPRMKFGVVVFPGSNCDHDTHHALGSVLGQPVDFIWHQSEDLAGCDAIVLPGGFAYGDYLRTGAIARFSPVMRAVTKFAKSGGLVLGICNGFQVLLESGLLPGAVLRNAGLRFVCRQVYIRVEHA